MNNPEAPDSHSRQALYGRIHRLEQRWDALRRRLKRGGGRSSPAYILPFLGYGNGSRALLSGRVLEDKPLGSPREDAPWWKNVQAMIYRFNSHELPDVGVQAQYAGQTVERVTDEEGYFSVEFALDAAAPPTPGWHDVALRLIEEPGSGRRAAAAGQFLLPPVRPDFCVVSDIDDTILQTYATDFWRMVRVTFLNNVRTRLPFEGVAAFYRALQQGPAGTSFNPIFYVSSSAWNLYDLLFDFIELHEIPKGPLLLQDWGVDDRQFITRSGHRHKIETIERLLAFYPTTPFILIGDSGQDDPALYTEAAQHYPGRILAIYIRDVHPERRANALEYARRCQDLGVPMLLSEDTEAAARHAAERGWISWPEIGKVEQEIDIDETRRGPQ